MQTTVDTCNPYERHKEISNTPSAMPIAIWAMILFAGSVWLTFLNSAQQLERHRILKAELDDLRMTLIRENLEANEIRNKAERLADTLRQMGWTPPAENDKK